MTRALLLSMPASDVTARCLSENVGVSSIERLASGGVRLVCMSSNGAARMRTVLNAKLIQGELLRERFRPRRAPR